MTMTLGQLKKLKTYELAEMLTNVVLLLKSMPDIECGQLLERVPADADVQAEPIRENVLTAEVLVEPIHERIPTADVQVEPIHERIPADVQVKPGIVELQQPIAPLFTREELKKKTVADLKVLAKSLNVFFNSSVKKDELIHKIMTRPADGKSEQHAIRDL